MLEESTRRCDSFTRIKRTTWQGENGRGAWAVLIEDNEAVVEVAAYVGRRARQRAEQHAELLRKISVE